jgi:hypothetical protein
MTHTSSSAAPAAAGQFNGSLTTAWRHSVLWRVLATNLPFVITLTFIHSVPEMVKALVVGAILFFVPGLAWTDRRLGDGFVVLFRAVLISLAISAATWLLLLPLPGGTSRIGFLVGIAAATNAGLVVGSRRGWYDPHTFRSTLFRSLTVVAVVFWVQSYVGAAHRIPPLEDHDMETQGTAYGLIHELRPKMVTNRNTVYFFAHPLLLHYWIGASALISDDLERLRYYRDSSETVRNLNWAGREAEWKQDFAHFLRDPVLLPTRTPNLFLGVLVVFPLGFIVYRLTDSHGAAIGACILYATFPEIYVRSAYGGYMAVTNFLMLSAAYLYLQGAGLFRHESTADQGFAPHAHGLCAAFLSGWANQKSLLVASSAVVHGAIISVPSLLKGGLAARFGRFAANRTAITALVIGSGFVLGWATYIVYGFAIAPNEFIADHLKGHFADRLRLNDLNLAHVRQGAWVYPSILALWLQFSQHSGWLFIVAATFGLSRALRHIRGAEGIFLIWFLIGAVGFSLIDWRQTKHLAKIVPPLVILTLLLWNSLNDRWRALVTLMLCTTVLWNVWRIGNLMVDFNFIKPLPIW